MSAHEEQSSRGPSAIKAMVQKGFERLQPHEQGQGNPSCILYPLLINAPTEAQIWDVLGHALKAGRAVSIPPAVGGAPGKQLITQVYNVFIEERGVFVPETKPHDKKLEVNGNENVVGSDNAYSDAARGESAVSTSQAKAKQDRLQQWKDMSELLQTAIKWLFSQADLSLGSSA